MGKFRSPPELNLKRARTPSSPYRNEADLFWNLNHNFLYIQMSQYKNHKFPKYFSSIQDESSPVSNFGFSEVNLFALRELWEIRRWQFGRIVMDPTTAIQSSHPQPNIEFVKSLTIVILLILQWIQHIDLTQRPI